MENLNKFYINGEWVTLSTQTMPVMNPATEAIIGTVALGNAADVDRAVAAASAAFGQLFPNKQGRADGLAEESENHHRGAV